jgi:hypothetical protein
MGSPVLSDGLSCRFSDESDASRTLDKIGNVERSRTVGLPRAARTALRSLSEVPKLLPP